MNCKLFAATVLQLLVMAYVCLAHPTTQATTQPARMTTEGVALPDPAAIQLKPVPVPTAGSFLGLRPEEAFPRAELYNFQNSKELFQQTLTKKLVSSDIFSAIAVEWFAVDHGKVIGFNLDRGLVVEAIIYEANASRSWRSKIERELGKLGKSEEVGLGEQTYRFTGDRLPVPFLARLVDSKVYTKSAAISVRFDPQAIYFALYSPSLETVKAIEDGKMIVGMTRREADLAIKNDYRSSWSGIISESEGTQVIGWYVRQSHTSNLAGGSYGVSGENVLIWRAVIRDNKIIEVYKRF